MELFAALTKEQFDALPEADRTFYVLSEKDGVYMPTIKPATIKIGDQTRLYALEDIAGLKNTLNKVNQVNHEFEKQVKLLQTQFEGIDPAEAREALRIKADMANWTPTEKVKEQIEAYKKEVTTAHNREMDAVKAERDKFKDENGKLLEARKRDRFATAATALIAKHEGKAALLLPALEKVTRFGTDERDEITMHIVDASGQPRYSTSAGHQYMSLEEQIIEWKNDSEYAGAFAATKAAGSGGAGGGGSPKVPAGSVRVGDREGIQNNLEAIAKGKVKVVAT